MNVKRRELKAMLSYLFLWTGIQNKTLEKLYNSCFRLHVLFVKDI
jgi:hypothetical protein